MIIADALLNLTEKRTVSPELFEVVKAIARTHRNRARHGDAPDAHDDAASELAGDFLVALAQKEISGLITTKACLRREFRRWLTRRDNPAKAELWGIVSHALLELEKQGVVERPPGFRTHHNRNETPWRLAGGTAEHPDWGKEPQIAAVMPRLVRKVVHDRVLKPAEARAAVKAILQTLGGEITMRDLVECIVQHVPLYQETTSMDAPTGNVDHDEPTTLHDHLEAKVLDDYSLFARDESEQASKAIWEEASAIRRGRKNPVEGVRVLCCYLLPKDVFGQDVTLADFGPTSTVQEVLADLRNILKRRLPESGRNRLEQSVFLSTVRGIIDQLVQFCSEIGYCMRLIEN